CFWAHNETLSWMDAQMACAVRDGQLAVLDVQPAPNAIIRLINYRSALWIGLTDQRVEGVYRWLDGTLPSVNSWGDFLPDGGSEENCVITSSNSRWIDKSCTKNQGFICQSAKYGMWAFIRFMSLTYGAKYT
ncbi:hypothetical protein CAPTEDRAFT_115954, partial [Capitella teleta]